jgi:hypothetical protein
MRRAWLLAATLLTCSCSKGSPGEASPGAPAPSSIASATAPAKAPSPPADAPGPSGWKGSYKSVAGTIALPKDVKWKVPDVAVGLGDGTIALTVDRATWRVQGKVEGVLGPAIVDGLAQDGKMTATVSREDPTDHGFTGTLSGDIADAATSGTMNLALADVSAVRNATFELAPVP